MASEHIKIGDVTPWVQYAGDGVQTQFGYSFPIFENDDLEIYLGASEVPETTGYAISGAGTSAGGLVSFETPPGNGVTVTLLRNVAIKRVTDFTESGDFRASVINNELDRLTAVAQQLSTLIGRTVRLAETDAAGSVQLPPAGIRASKIAAFDASGDLVAANPAATTLLVSAYMEGVVLAADAAAARVLLDAQAQSGVLDDIAALTPAKGDGLLFDGVNWTAGRAVEQAEIRRLALDVAALKGDRENMVDGIADPFADATDIDAADSTNEVLVGSFFQGLTQTAGLAVADAKTGSNVSALNGTVPHAGIRWVQSGDAIILGARIDVHAVSVTGTVEVRMYVRNSSTIIATTGTVALTATGETDFLFTEPVIVSNGVEYVIAFVRATGTFTLSTVTRPGTGTTATTLNGSDVHTSFPDHNNVDASEDLRIGALVGTPANLALVSEGFTADAEPDTALIHVQVVENETITINTDLIAKVSRDDGVTWTTAVLGAAGELADGTKIYEATGIDISGQPSGTDMRYRIETDNAKDIGIHGVVLKWG
jgi:hypothetical protein